MSENHLKRFWSKVQRGRPNDCWLWTAGINGNGYGTFTVGSRSNQRTWDAHRFAFLVLVGTPENHLVLDHLCDVKRCVNPSHLQPVSQSDERPSLANQITPWPVRPSVPVVVCLVGAGAEAMQEQVPEWATTVVVDT